MKGTDHQTQGNGVDPRVKYCPLLKDTRQGHIDGIQEGLLKLLIGRRSWIDVHI